MKASYCYKATPSYGWKGGRQREKRKQQEEIVAYTSDEESIGAWIKRDKKREKRRGGKRGRLRRKLD